MRSCSIGANPRWEAPVLNARIRKTWLACGIKIANVGVAYDLTYPVQQLGETAAVLEQIASGAHPFAKVLKDAKRPMLIVGPGVVARPDGAALLKLAAKIAGDTGMIGPAGKPSEGGWNGFNVLHTAASRVAGARSAASCRAKAVAMWPAFSMARQKGEIDFVYLARRR